MTKLYPVFALAFVAILILSMAILPASAEAAPDARPGDCSTYWANGKLWCQCVGSDGYNHSAPRWRCGLRR